MKKGIVVASVLAAVVGTTSFVSASNIGSQNEKGNGRNFEKLQTYAEEKGMTTEELRTYLDSLTDDERLEEMASIKGVTVEELQEREAEREARLQEMADEKGITVEELKEEMPNRKGGNRKGHEELEAYAEENEMTMEELRNHLDSLTEDERLEEMASIKGVTVEELQKREADRETRLQEMADEKGITVEELKKQMANRKGVGRGLRK